MMDVDVARFFEKSYFIHQQQVAYRSVVAQSDHGDGFACHLLPSYRKGSTPLRCWMVDWKQRMTTKVPLSPPSASGPGGGNGTAVSWDRPTHTVVDNFGAEAHDPAPHDALEDGICDRELEHGHAVAFPVREGGLYSILPVHGSP
jgi:hypothetical protein